MAKGSSEIKSGLENKELVYISESMDLKRVDESNKQLSSYVYEGTAAVFDQQNENKRTYDKDEYIPHLSYLQDKIVKKRLLGELDHPSSFEISMKNVSHIVEKVWYDENSDTVKIRIRLLDTPNGRIAMKMADAGIPLAISSRAAGQVLEAGRVKIHKIFTFDLVAEPGFSQAILSPVINEGIKNDYQSLCDNFSCMKEDSVFDKLEDVSESYGFNGDVKIYKLNEEMYDELVKSIDEDGPVHDKNNENEMYVKQEELQGFSEELKTLIKESMDKIESLNKDVSKLKKIYEKDDKEETEEIGSETETGETETDGNGGESVELVDDVTNSETDNDIDIVDTEKPETEDPVETPETSAENELRILKNFVNYLVVQINAMANHIEHMRGELNKDINYTEAIGETVNGLANFGNYTGHKLNVAYNFLEMLAATTNEGLNHQDYMSNVINYIINHIDGEILEKLNASIDFENYLSGEMNEHIHFSKHLRDVINSGNLGDRFKKGDRNLKDVKRIVESVNQEVEQNEDIHDAIDKFVDKVSNSRDSVLENRYPFLKLIDAENKNKFYKLDMDTKKDIVATMESSIYTTKEEVLSLMNQVVENKKNQKPIYLAYMPEKYKELWEQMNESERANLARRAKTYNMSTPYHVKTFWDTHDFDNQKARLHEEKMAEESAKIYEGQSKEGFVPNKVVADRMRGYSDEYVQRIARGAKK